MNALIRILLTLSLLTSSQPSQAGWLRSLFVGGAAAGVTSELTAQLAVRAAAAYAVTSFGKRNAASASDNLRAVLAQHPFIGRSLLVTALADIVYNDRTLRPYVVAVGAIFNISVEEISRKTARVTILSGIITKDMDPNCRDDDPWSQHDVIRTDGPSYEGQKLPPERFVNQTVMIEDQGATFWVRFNAWGWPDFTRYAKADLRVANTAGFFASNHTEQMKNATVELRRLIDNGSMNNPFPEGSKEAIAIRKGLPKIPGYTWHHHQDPGRMQLVPEGLHNRTKHYGGWYSNKCLQTHEANNKNGRGVK